MNAIEVCNLTKRFGPLTALDGVTLEVAQGELFGLIGPDGAGKTTLFRLLATLLTPDAGTASVEGLDVVRDYRRIRERIGYMPGRFSLYPDLSVEENLAFFAALFGTTVAENYDLVAPIYRQIEPFRKRRAGKLSGGMKQKLALSCALIHRPSVLLLDEPTSALDPELVGEVLDVIKKVAAQGYTMLLVSHEMNFIRHVSNRVIFLDKGHVVEDGTPKEVFEHPQNQRTREFFSKMHIMAQPEYVI